MNVDIAKPRLSDQLREAAQDLLAKVDARVAARKRAQSRDKVKLGFGVRACQGYFALSFVIALTYALITAPADFAYDFSMVHGMFVSAASLVAIWLIQKRAATARAAAIGIVVACLVFSVIDMFLLGAFEVVSGRIGATAAAGILMAQYIGIACVTFYMATSSKAAQVLSVPMDRSSYERGTHSWDKPMKERVRTWEFWRDLAMYFIVFSFMGHWAEMLFCYNIHLGVFMGDVDFSEVMLWHQWLFPYCAEGVAVALIVVLLHPAKQALSKRFGGRIIPTLLASMAIIAIVCTTIDFTCGMICNQNYEVWDYRALPFNFMGQVCLQNSTVYTIAATLIVWVFYPLMDRGIHRLPRSWADGLFFALVGIYAFSALLHFMYVGDAGLIVGAFEM